jgi:hypothetical protein
MKRVHDMRAKGHSPARCCRGPRVFRRTAGQTWSVDGMALEVCATQVTLEPGRGL